MAKEDIGGSFLGKMKKKKKGKYKKSSSVKVKDTVKEDSSFLTKIKKNKFKIGKA